MLPTQRTYTNKKKRQKTNVIFWFSEEKNPVRIQNKRNYKRAEQPKKIYNKLLNLLSNKQMELLNIHVTKMK